MAVPGVSPHTLPPLATEHASGGTTAWRRWLRLAVAIAAVAAAVVVLRLTYFRPVAVPVTVARVETGRVEELVTNNKAGTITARRRAGLTPEIGGRIARLPVRDGDQVRAGAVLLALDDSQLRAQIVLQERTLETSSAAAVEACAARDLAARELERNGRLYAAGVVSKQALEQAENRNTTADATCATATAAVGQARANLDMARINLDKAVLRAPFAGTVSSVSVHLGEWVTPAPTGLALPPAIELVDMNSIYVRAPIDEVDAGKLRVGLPARITMDAFPERSFAGHVTYVGAYVSEVQQQNRTFDIEVAFDDPSIASRLLPGTSADVEIILSARDQVLRVPTSAVMQGDRVLVVRDQQLVSVPIKTGLSNWEFTEVASGLAAGDDVVVSLDRVEVKAGARAVIATEPAP